eukprot:2682558-Pyramimonas_sp.AAC.1
MREGGAALLRCPPSAPLASRDRTHCAANLRVQSAIESSQWVQSAGGAIRNRKQSASAIGRGCNPQSKAVSGCNRQGVKSAIESSQR